MKADIFSKIKGSDGRNIRLNGIKYTNQIKSQGEKE